MLAANLVLRAQLAELDASIAELNSRLRVLEEARWPIKTQLDCIVYPILSLPPEITSEIFLRCVPPSPVEDERLELSSLPRLAPLLLLQVCKTWREIALSTHRLWNCLNLTDFRVNRASSLNMIPKIVADWFGRAGSSPLILSVDLCAAQLRVDFRVLSSILRPLAPRLKELCLDFLRADELPDIGPFPILQTLTLSYHSTEYPDSPLKLFSAAPRLHRLSFSRRTRPSMFILPPAISEVTCHGFLIAEDLLQLLRDAPFLKKLACSIFKISSRTEPFTHDHFETLHCNFHPVLELLRLPMLQNLYLSEGYDIEDTADYHFPSFLSSSTRLRRFCTDVAIPSMSVDWFATAMPGLMDIDLTNPKPPFLSDFFARLDRTKDSSFLPNLRTLTFRDAAFALDASVLQALSSRFTADENAAMLEAFQLFRPQLKPGSSEEYLDDSAIAACRELVGRGMSIHVGPIGKNWL
ncbi:hypothetical protein C8R46DRAFT_1355576 [Mycena filopes]|nr:hypothetical protein C8R46DRAFT_1355576 [Mycena filopes]